MNRRELVPAYHSAASNALELHRVELRVALPTVRS
jgi:hypothetical protein